MNFPPVTVKPFSAPLRGCANSHAIGVLRAARVYSTIREKQKKKSTVGIGSLDSVIRKTPIVGAEYHII